jgi:beta-fructofuranosidase
MKYLLYMLLPLMFTLLSSCDVEQSAVELPEKGSVSQGDITLFPKSEDGYVGDPMPFYDGETMNMFYLLDERRGGIGFHPYALFQTTDFLSWDDIGTVIPYVNSISSPDMALGTGSIIQDKDGLYHAFYTGYNGTGEMPYFEKIQHATSTDMINWEKHPEDGFYGGMNDFRDPYIYYDEPSDEYWMLLTAREGSTGVIRRYTSTDLVTWTNNGVFYRNDAGSYNMECPTLFEYNGYYYLTFSEQGEGNDRVVHYRYTSDLKSDFITPANDSFDGWGFYAGRVEKVGEQLVLSGWVATKTLYIDKGHYIWGGNLVNHQLYQLANGELRVTILDQIDQKLSNEVSYEVASSNVDEEDSGFIFNKNKGYNYVLYDSLLEKATKTEFEVDISDSTNFGITLNAYESVIGDLNIYFDIENNQIEFYNVANNLISSSAPEIQIDYQFGDTVEGVLVTEGSILVLYINGEKALTSRAYNMVGSEFGFFTLGSDAILKDVHFYE